MNYKTIFNRFYCGYIKKCNDCGSSCVVVVLLETTKVTCFTCRFNNNSIYYRLKEFATKHNVSVAVEQDVTIINVLKPTASMIILLNTILDAYTLKT